MFFFGVEISWSLIEDFLQVWESEIEFARSNFHRNWVATPKYNPKPIFEVLANSYHKDIKIDFAHLTQPMAKL